MQGDVDKKRRRQQQEYEKSIEKVYRQLKSTERIDHDGSGGVGWGNERSAETGADGVRGIARAACGVRVERGMGVCAFAHSSAFGFALCDALGQRICIYVVVPVCDPVDGSFHVRGATYSVLG